MDFMIRIRRQDFWILIGLAFLSGYIVASSIVPNALDWACK